MNSNNFGGLFTPDYSHVTGLVQHLNSEELKSILNNDDKAIELINDLKQIKDIEAEREMLIANYFEMFQIKDIEAEREMLIASNKSISEYNLSQQPIMDECRENVNSTYRRAVELRENLLVAKLKIESQPVAQSKDTLLALLQAATSEIEEEAEATVDAFLKKDLSVEDFLEKYLELRKLAHLRRIKSEKLSSIIQSDGNPMPTPEKPQRLRKPPAPPVPPVSNSSALPYPSSAYPLYGGNELARNIPGRPTVFPSNPVGPNRPAPPVPAYPHLNPYQNFHTMRAPFSLQQDPLPQMNNSYPIRRG